MVLRNSLSAALAAAFLVSGSAALFSGSAGAQVFDSLRNKQKGQQQAQGQRRGCQLAGTEGERQYRLGAEECTAVAPLVEAVGRQDWAAAQAAIPAAQAGARGADAKYVVGQAILHIGIGTSNTRIQAQAIDAIIASGGAQQSEMRALYENQLRLALAAGDTAKAAQAQAQLDALNPNDPTRFVRQAGIRAQANDYAGALALYQQAIQAQQGAGQQIPTEWRQRMAALAYQGRLPDTTRYFREWLQAAPSPSSWHDTLAIYAEQASDNALKLDIYRLMRAAGAMVAERDFIQYGAAAEDARLFGEISSVLQDGLNRNLITANTGYAREQLAAVSGRVTADRASLPGERQGALAGNDGRALLRLADAHYGYGQYAEAAELYRAAIQKGGQDSNLLNTRLGAALARAGRRAEAEAAFRAVTGPRAELANLWLFWLSRQA
jgi:tetratricopeptide (TPR) repeat protein